MRYTQTEEFVLSLAKNNDSVSLETVEDISSKLVQEGNESTFNYAFRKFIDAVCPNCAEAGLYKFHLFGRLRHNKCNNSWYISPGKYALIQLRKSAWGGVSFASGIASEDEKKGEKSSTLGWIFHFIVGFVFRITFTIISIPIQIILYLFNRPKAPIILEGKSNERI